ncbi:hypothetical protein HBB16_16555 [Pseudonocardia sp. MCCB 268]|nr:hypothetical protein [Pseudonocardia cytotoxica]
MLRLERGPRMPAAMQTEYLHALPGEPVRQGKLELAGAARRHDVHPDRYVICAENDHIAPWKSTVYKGAAKIGGTVSSCSQLRPHRRRGEPALAEVADLVRRVGPPARSRPTTGATTPASARRPGGKDWTPWIAERAGKEGPAPSASALRTPTRRWSRRPAPLRRRGLTPPGPTRPGPAPGVITVDRRGGAVQQRPRCPAARAVRARQPSENRDNARPWTGYQRARQG